MLRNHGQSYPRGTISQPCPAKTGFAGSVATPKSALVKPLRILAAAAGGTARQALNSSHVHSLCHSGSSGHRTLLACRPAQSATLGRAGISTRARAVRASWRNGGGARVGGRAVGADSLARRAGLCLQGKALRAPAIRSGEESVFCSTALLRRGLTSADSSLRASVCRRFSGERSLRIIGCGVKPIQRGQT